MRSRLSVDSFSGWALCDLMLWSTAVRCPRSTNHERNVKHERALEINLRYSFVLETWQAGIRPVIAVSSRRRLVKRQCAKKTHSTGLSTSQLIGAFALSVGKKRVQGAIVVKGAEWGRHGRKEASMFLCIFHLSRPMLTNLEVFLIPYIH